MDLVAIGILTGINTGFLIGMAVAFFGRPRNSKPDRRDAPRPTTDDLGNAMGHLCSLVNEHTDDWERIEITRSGQNAATMTIKSVGGRSISPLDPSKMN